MYKPLVTLQKWFYSINSHYALISNFLELQRHTKPIKEPTAANSKKTASKQEKDKEIKCSETKNAATTSKSHPSGDKSKSPVKKMVKTIDTKKPVSTDAASKGTSTDSNDGQRKKSVHLSTGWVMSLNTFISYGTWKKFQSVIQGCTPWSTRPPWPDITWRW